MLRQPTLIALSYKKLYNALLADDVAAEKRVKFVGSSKDDISGFPDDARTIAGHQLHRIQKGLDPDDFKPMPDVGSGVYEIRVKTDAEHRVFYVTKFGDWIYVLHAFEKKSQKTPTKDIQLAAKRYKQLVASFKGK
jgi:phage-related protein